MTKILYCWEHGSGFGHVTKMKSICECLPDERIIIAGKELDKVQKYFDYDDVYSFVQTPYIKPKDNDSYAFTYSQMLMVLGHSDNKKSSFLIKAWKHLIETNNPDMVICDFAPSAAIVAKLLGIPVKMIGTGYEIPSFEDHLPSIAVWDKEIDKNFCLQTDKQLLGILNSSLENNGLSKITDLSLLSNDNNSIILSPEELDYFSRKNANFENLRFLEKEMGYKNIWSTNKPKILCILKFAHPDIVKSLISLSNEFEIKGFFEIIDPRNRSIICHSGIHVFDDIINLENAFQETDLVVTNGGFNIIRKAGWHNIKVLTIPLHGEQRLLSHILARDGLIKTVSPDSCHNVNIKKFIIDTIFGFDSNPLYNIMNKNLISDYSPVIKRFIHH